MGCGEVELFVLQVINSHWYFFMGNQEFRNTIRKKNLRACTCIKTWSSNENEHLHELYTRMGAAHCMQSYDFVELWAGTAWTTTMVRKSGRNTAALDIEYFQVDPQKPHRSNHFDIMTPSGFLFLGMSSCCFHWRLIPTNQWVSCFHEVPINNS